MSPIHSWWDWCTESFGHMFAGVTAPILIALAFLVLVIAGCDGDGGSTAFGPQPPRSDVAGVCVTGTPGAAADTNCGTPIDGLLVSTATPVPPTPTPAPRSYTVQSGDSLYRICINELPDMDADACIDAIVKLSHLDGPDEITEGQVLRLPPKASATPASGTPATSSTTGSRRTPSPVATAFAEPTPVEEIVFEPEATEEPEPEPTAEPTPYASIIAIGETVEEDEPEDEPAPTDDESDASEGAEYTVQDGDSLLGICVSEVPEMDEDECMELVVLLNDLSGPDEIQSGQVLRLP